MRLLVCIAGAWVLIGVLFLVRGALLGPSGAVPRDALVVWFHQYGEAGTDEALQRYALAFERAHPGDRLKVTMVPGAYAAKVNAALLARQAPDVFEHVVTLDDVRNGMLAQLNALFPDDIRSDFDPFAMQAVTVGDTVYGVRIVTDTGLLYYRPSMLRAAGVEPPRTLRALVNAARALTRAPRKGLFLGNDGGANSHYARLIIWSAGEEIITRNGCAFEVARAARGLAMIRELNEGGGLLIGATADWWDPSAFINGEVAMQWCGLWAMPAIRRALGDDFGVLPWPAADEHGTPTTFLGGHSLCVNAASSRRERALEYLRWTWIENLEIQEDWNLAYGFHLPARGTVAARAATLQGGVAAEALRLAHQYGRNERNWLWTSGMDAALNSAVAAVVKRGADPARELRVAVVQIERELGRALGK